MHYPMLPYRKVIHNNNISEVSKEVSHWSRNKDDRAVYYVTNKVAQKRMNE